MAGMRRVVSLITAITFCVGLTAVAGASIATSDPQDRAAKASFVEREGNRLLLNGAPFKFTGINVYNANSVDNCWYTMGEDSQDAGMVLHKTLNRLGGGNEVIRAWFFQPMATRDGERDWSAFDHTLTMARRDGFKVIATLVNQWGQCEGWNDYAGGYKTEQWYRSGYRTQPSSPGMPATYKRWVAEVVSRYKDDPAILAWQLVNEAEDRTAYDGTCSDTASATLKAFADDMSSAVKRLDPNHLVSLGTIGTGQCGTSGAEYKDVHSVPGIDLCEYHDYSADVMPGDEWNGMAVRLRQCRELDKPLIVGEMGVKAQDVGGLLPRAGLFAAKLGAQFRAGITGALAWTWRNGANGGSSDQGYEIGPGDPVLGVLGSF
jgi:mannan endo-1,4-beta-mannosidase